MVRKGEYDCEYDGEYQCLIVDNVERGELPALAFSHRCSPLLMNMGDVFVCAVCVDEVLSVLELLVVIGVLIIEGETG